METDNHLRALIELCSHHLDEGFERAVRAATTQLNNKLQALADQESTDFSFALNLIESNAELMVSELVRCALDFDSKTLPPASEEASHAFADSDPILSLVSKDEFEDWLLVDVSKKKLERELASSLPNVCLVFNQVTEKQYDLSSLPIAPEHILTTLKSLIEKLKIPPNTQISIYRSFGASLTEDLERIYLLLLTEAKRRGLRTEDASIKPGKARSKTQSLAPEDDAYANTDPYQSGNTRTENETSDPVFGSGRLAESLQATQSESRYSSLNTLARMGAALSNGHRLGAQHATSSGEENLGFNNEASPLLLALRQGQGAFSNSLDSGQNLRDWLRLQLSSNSLSDQDISIQDNELLEVTDNLLQAVETQARSNSVLNDWLEKLKIVILKSVLADPSFFKNAEHPTRRLLNQLGSLAEVVDGGHSRLQTILDRSIDRVVQDYDENTDSVEQVLEELNTIFERHVAAYKRNSERLARSYDGKQRIATARHKIETDINALIGKAAFPQVLSRVLDEAGGREYLALLAIQGEAEKGSYSIALSTLEQLQRWLISLAETSDDEYRNTLFVDISTEAPALIAVIEDDLRAQGKAGLERVLSDLRAQLLGEQEIAIQSEDYRYQWPFGVGEDDLKDLAPKPDDMQGRSRWHRQLLEMKPGDWLQLNRSDGSQRILRLAWAGIESFRFVFVDNQGMKDEDLSIDELAKRMKAGSARLIEHSDVPLVDQGLHRMVQSVYEDLSSQSNCDALTGLLTRQALERALDQTTALSNASKSDAVFIYLDINSFNVTNSTYGLAAGDAVLKSVSEILRQHCIENSFCGRLGGNEFGLVLQGCDEMHAAHVAESIEQALEQSPPNHQGRSLPISLSMGVTLIDHEVDDYDSILRKAEFACRRAKSDPNESIVLYELNSDDQRRRDDFLYWVSRLDGNLDDLLELRVQEIRPNTDHQNGYSHWEILLGIKHDGQTIPPAPVIEAAENFGKMVVVDRWVVSTSIQWMLDNPDFVSKSEGFSINLSGQSLSDHQFLDFVVAKIESSNIDPSKLCFEITETSAIVNLNFATEFIHQLKKKGCKFSLDDFGSGLSSYAYIQKLPVDFIKIDGMFIRNIQNSSRDQALVRSINELAHFMGMQTVAEFVENMEILSILQSIGVDHSQGYGIRKPMLLRELSGSNVKAS